MSMTPVEFHHLRSLEFEKKTIPWGRLTVPR